MAVPPLIEAMSGTRAHAVLRLHTLMSIAPLTAVPTAPLDRGWCLPTENAIVIVTVLITMGIAIALRIWVVRFMASLITEADILGKAISHVFVLLIATRGALVGAVGHVVVLSAVAALELSLVASMLLGPPTVLILVV